MSETPTLYILHWSRAGSNRQPPGCKPENIQFQPDTEQALTTPDNSDCTSACTKIAKPTHDHPEVTTPKDDFAAALAMIATLPLTDAEKAEVIRQLLANREGGKP